MFVRFGRFLQFEEQTGDATKAIGQVEILGEIDLGSIGIGLREQEKFGEAGGGELEANLRESCGSFGAEVKEGVLLDAGGGDAFLCIEPVLIATSIPIGDITRGDTNAEFIESVDDLGIGGAVFEHVVDEVAVGFGQGGDFAVTSTIYD